MADTKVSALTELAAAPAADDELLVVDKSDTAMAASGTDKRMRYDRISGLWIPQSLIDAKGDLIAGSAADTAARVAVGSNNAALVADSSQAAGVKWQGADAAAATASTRTLGTGAAQAAAGDQTEYAFSSYRLLAKGGTNLGASTAAGTFLLYEAGNLALAAAGSVFCAFYVDPADFAAGTRTAKLKLVCWTITNAVAPGVNFTFTLSPVATWNGASGVRSGVATLGTATISQAINTPGLSTRTTGTSADVTFPAAGFYVLTVANSGTTAANSNTDVGVRLYMRQV